MQLIFIQGLPWEDCKCVFTIFYLIIRTSTSRQVTLPRFSNRVGSCHLSGLSLLGGIKTRVLILRGHSPAHVASSPATPGITTSMI